MNTFAIVMFIYLPICFIGMGLIVWKYRKDDEEREKLTKEVNDILDETRERARNLQSIEALEVLDKELSDLILYVKSGENQRRLIQRGFVAGRIYQMSKQKEEIKNERNRKGVYYPPTDYRIRKQENET